MRVLNLCTQDIAGIGHRTAEAFGRHAPGWTFDHVALHPNYLAYPPGRSPDEVPDLIRAADVVMLHQSFKLADRYRINTPIVLMHHGSKFRRNHEALLAEQRRRRATGLATTLDLWLMAPDDLEYAPPGYDLGWLATFRQPVDDGVLRIAHAPTNRVNKSTDAFLTAARKLGRETPVEVILIEGKPWLECLRLKGTADILFDQVRIVPGVNGVEAMGMGIPVVAGAPTRVLEEMRRWFGSLPFVEADEGSIYHALRSLTDADTRRRWAARGLDHVTQWHDDARVVTQLQRVYREAAS